MGDIHIFGPEAAAQHTVRTGCEQLRGCTKNAPSTWRLAGRVTMLAVTFHEREETRL
jgi:hypothetical protein